MNFTRDEMINIIREEYEKRVQYYANLSEIEIKDDHDNDLIANAKGLKVKDKAGFIYTVYDIINDEEGHTVVRLIGPGEGGKEEMEPKSTSSIFEDESENKEKKKSSNNPENSSNTLKSSDIISRNPEKAFKRSFKTDAKQKSLKDEYEKTAGYYHVPIKEFEKVFSL